MKSRGSKWIAQWSVPETKQRRLGVWLPSDWGSTSLASSSFSKVVSWSEGNQMADGRQRTTPAKAKRYLNLTELWSSVNSSESSWLKVWKHLLDKSCIFPGCFVLGQIAPFDQPSPHRDADYPLMAWDQLSFQKFLRLQQDSSIRVKERQLYGIAWGPQMVHQLTCMKSMVYLTIFW